MIRRTGFTIVEAAVSVAVVGVLLVASTGTFTSIARSRQIQLERREAYQLAQSLMAEACAEYFTTPASSGTAAVGGSAASRAGFTSVDAYNGYTASPPADASGNPLADYTNWSESVAVTRVDPTNPSASLTSSTLKRIVVTVTSPGGKTYQLVSLRSQYGAYETVPSSPINYVTGVSVAVQGATPSKTVYTGARPLNITTSQ